MATQDSEKIKVLKERMKQKWHFQRVGGGAGQTKIK